LAALLDDGETGAADYDRIQPTTQSRDRLPLSFAQQRMLVLHEMNPDAWRYTTPHAFRLRGALDVAALEWAMTEMVRRHEILRTTISVFDEGPMQVVGPPREIRIPVVPLESGCDPDLAIQKFVDDQIRQSFDLSRGPVFRCSLLRLDREDHAFVITLHHIASDGWSAGVLSRELSELYTAHRERRPHQLDPLPIGYGDYAVWQRSSQHQGTLRRQLSYWKKRLAGIPVRLELPPRKTRPEELSSAGDVELFRISGDVMFQFRRLLRAEGASLFMGMLAAVTAFLAKYSGQDDIVIGTPVAAGRDRIELQGMLGILVNTVAMRNSVAGDPTFRQLLQQARDHAFDAYENAEAPFDQLVDELQPERNLSHSPIFQVLLVQNSSENSWKLKGLKVKAIGFETKTAKFELTFAVREDGDVLRGGIVYSTDLFDAPFVARMAANLSQFVANAVSAPDVPLSELAILCPDERRTVIHEYNQTARHYADREPALHELFEQQAASRPGDTAIYHNGVAMTYGELDRRAGEIAAAICARRSGDTEGIVAICLPRSSELIAAILGVLKAGCAFLALDANYPSARLLGMIDDARPFCLITISELSLHLPSATPRLFLDEPLPAPSGALPGQSGGDRLAYVIYTSGSTGKPKGTAIAHRSAITLLRWAREVFDAEDLSGVLASTSTCFDLSIFEIFVPLGFGGSMILAENALDLPNLRDKDRVKLVNTVPSAITELLRVGGLPTSVRTVNLAGEALSRPLAEQVLEQEHIRNLFNLYGPTEDTTYSTYARIQPGEDGPVPIGKAIANSRAYVLDRNLIPVPAGVNGDLYLAGEGLARGYLNRPGMTAERFLPDPFGPPGARMYRTGDVARWRDCGALDYLGRSDHQVKIRGFRIELGEIEAVLDKHPGVERTVVLAREDQPGNKRLVAYFVPNHAAPVHERDLRSALRKTLPEFMIPSTFVSMAAFPLTANGKIDRTGFAPPTARPDLRQRYLPANDPLRSQLVTIWEDLLGVRPVGIRDDFFQLGGDSLLAVQLVYRIDKACGVKLPLGMLFRFPTIESLSTAMVRRESDSWDTRLVEIQPGNPAVRPPFFYLHADFVSGGFYAVDLARRLGPEQPFYVLQPHGLDGGNVPLTIEEMAQEHLEAVRRVQPRGPYYLGGKCNGSLIAFEMARRLHECGEEVRLLAIVHGWAGTLYSRVEQTFKPASRPPNPDLMKSSNYQTSKIWAFYRYMWAIKTFAPQPYAGKLTLLWPHEIPIKGDDPTLGWSQVAKTVDRRLIPGDAYTCITRHIDTLGAELRTLLDQA
jgi:amino acid adenylation domain-containing protein